MCKVSVKIIPNKKTILDNNLKSIYKMYRLTFAQSVRIVIILAAFTERKVRYEKLKIKTHRLFERNILGDLKTAKSLTYKGHRHLYFRSIQLHSLQNTNQTRSKQTKHTFSSRPNSSEQCWLLIHLILILMHKVLVSPL